MKGLLALVAALLLGLPAALLARDAAGALQTAPDPVAVGAVVYPGAPLVVTADPFASDRPAWLRFMMAQNRAPAPEVRPRNRPAGTAPPLIQATRQRLAAAGWEIEEGIPDSLAFAATKDDVRVAFYAFDMDPVGLDTFTTVSTQPSWWTQRAALGGGVLGALAGIWLARWARRRFATKQARARTAIRETTVVGVALVVPALVQSVVRWSGTTWEPAGSSSVTLVLGYARWPAALGVALLAGTVVALAVGRRSGHGAGPAPDGPAVGGPALGGPALGGSAADGSPVAAPAQGSGVDGPPQAPPPGAPGV